MDNAHERMGWLVYTSEATSVRIGLERAIYEKPSSRFESGTLHLASVFGGDTAIQALRTALSQDLTVTIIRPDGERIQCSTRWKETRTIKSDIRVADRKRPLRHLIVASPVLLGNTADPTVILPKHDSDMLWKRLVFTLGIPGIPAWTDYITDKLRKEDRITELEGVNCTPIMITATKDELMEWLSEGLKTGAIQFPNEKGMVAWPSYTLDDVFPCERVTSHEEPANG